MMYMYKVVEVDGKRFFDFSGEAVNATAILQSMRHVPHGFILPSDAPADLEAELTQTGHEVRRATT